MKSTIIFKNAHYTACHMRDDSLIITKNRTKKGIRLVGETAIEFGHALQSAIDRNESHALCRVVFNQ